MSPIHDPSLTGQTPAYATQTHVYDRNKPVADTESGGKGVNTRTIRDTVEISDEARHMAGTLKGDVTPTTLERIEEPEPERSILGPKKVLERGSKEEEKFKELLAGVKANKSKLTGQIESILKKAGIPPAKFGKARLEVDSSGKILVGGIDDEDLAKKIEKALNEDKELGKQLKQYQKDEKALSSQIKEYTGCSLYELTQASKGDANLRIRDAVEKAGLDPEENYFAELGFIEGALSDIMGLDDIGDLSFKGIDFSGEISILSRPEETIKEKMSEVVAKAKEVFESINKDFLDTLAEGGYSLNDLDQEFLDTYLLDISRTTFSVDSKGGIQIDGQFAGDLRTHNKGEEVLRGFINEMLSETDDNSYHLNLFTEAGQTLLDDMAATLELDYLEPDAKAVVKVSNGMVEEKVSVVSPETEARIQKDVQDTVNEMLEVEGVELSSPVEIEVDGEGRVHAVNLEEGTEEAKAVQDLLDRMNMELDVQRRTERKSEGEDSDEDEDEMLVRAGEEKDEKAAPRMTWEGGLQQILGLTDKLETLRKG